MQTGRSIEQMHETLMNEKAAAGARAEHTSNADNVKFKQWMINKGINISAYERDMKQL